MPPRSKTDGRRWSKRTLLAAGTALLLVAIAAVVGVGYVRNKLNGPAPHRWPTTSLGADEVLEYKQTPKRPLHLHLFKPTGAPTGAIVFFHGGGLEQTPLDQFVRQAQHLAGEGMLAVIAEYRVKWDGAGFSEATTDASAAIAWVRAHAAELGTPPERIAASGASAGGMLAAATELVPGDGHPDALVLFNPAVSARSANPNGGVSTLVMHGDADHLVALSSAKGFCDATTACELMVWPGGDHGFFNEGAAFSATLDRVDTFLHTLGYITTTG